MDSKHLVSLLLCRPTSFSPSKPIANRQPWKIEKLSRTIKQAGKAWMSQSALAQYHTLTAACGLTGNDRKAQTKGSWESMSKLMWLVGRTFQLISATCKLCDFGELYACKNAQTFDIHSIVIKLCNFICFFCCCCWAICIAIFQVGTTWQGVGVFKTNAPCHRHGFLTYPRRQRISPHLCKQRLRTAKYVASSSKDTNIPYLTTYTVLLVTLKITGN